MIEPEPMNGADWLMLEFDAQFERMAEEAKAEAAEAARLRDKFKHGFAGWQMGPQAE